jgi:hypothetical protein
MAAIMTEETATGGLMSIFRTITNGPYSMKTWSLLCACTAGEAFLLYAILIAHTLRPVTAQLIGHNSSHPSASARYREIFNWNGLIPTMLGSLLVVAAVWAALQITVRAFARAPLEELQMALADPTSSAVINLGERTFSDLSDPSPGLERNFTDSATAMPSRA